MEATQGNMRLHRLTINGETLSIPAVILQHERPRGQAVIVHGYGGCKEEALGLAWRIAEWGFDAVAIDLRGHGENPPPYDEGILEDVEAAVRQRKAVGRVVAVGHSLGGRLCLLSGADYKIGISPALMTTHSESTRKLINAIRGHRVREIRPGINFDTLESLPAWDAADRERALLICCTRDVPEIGVTCTEMEAKGVRVERVEDASHGDVFLNEKTFAVMRRQLDAWFE